MKFIKFTNVIYVQGHGAKLLLQIGSTVWCFGDSGNYNKGANLEIRIFAPMAEKRFSVKLNRV